MVTSGDVLLDIACSPQVRAAVQAIFPSVRFRLYDMEAFVGGNRAALNEACAVVLALRSQQGAPSTPVIEQLRAIAPHIGVFVVEERSEAVDPWLPRLAASGADDAFALDRPGDEKIATLLGFATLEELRKERWRVRAGATQSPDLSALLG